MPENENKKIRSPLMFDRPVAVVENPCAYAELDAVTSFSFLRGASQPDELVYTAALLGYRALAVCDVNSVAGVVQAYEAARQVAGFQLIVGARLVFSDGTPDLLVWPSDRAAYGRLCRLLTVGRMRAPKGECHLTLADFLEWNQGLLAACDVARASSPWPGVFTMECRSPPGVVGHGLEARATELRLVPDDLHFFRTLRSELGDRLSIAAGLSFGGDDVQCLNQLRQLSHDTHIPLLATNHVHYHDRGRRMLQDVLTCVRHGVTLHEAGFKLFPNGERYLKSPQQMHRLFRDCPQAIDRALEVARACRFDLGSLGYEYPDESVPAGVSPTQHLRQLSYDGAAERYPAGIPDKVRGLLEHELAFISNTRYEPYFLTVHDLVQFARSRGILCQGRGSAANSAVCYCLGVTSVDPAHFQLVFERFASPERHEPPDIDIDFEHERREEVIQYVYQKYGRDRAAMTASVITYRGRSAVRDVGKALGLSADLIDQLATKLDWWHRGTLLTSHLKEAGIDSNDITIRTLIHLSGQLLGFPRHLSQHVGGMVISRTRLDECVPLENAAMADRTVIEWDKDDIQTLCMFKVDLLSLGMLTCISKTMGYVNELSTADCQLPIEESTIDNRQSTIGNLQLHTIPHEDPAVYAMASDADTVGVFQIESRAQMSMLPRLRPERFYDLVIEVAIVRPGPIQGDMVHPYLQRREIWRRDRSYQGDYPPGKDELRQVLKDTLGVPLFQEQAMRLASVAAGFTVAEADALRRSMKAWKRGDGLHKFHDKFIQGMLKNGYDLTFAENCFNQICGFGEYGFPESHAASFAKLVYASAWLKRHHPAAFVAGLLNSQPMGFYAPAQLIRDAREHGVEVRPIDVNASDWDCTLEAIRHRGTETQRPLKENALCLCASVSNGIAPKSTWGLHGPSLRLGFRMLKGFRQVDAEQIAMARAGGAFRSIEDFHRRSDVSTAVLRRLAEADAFSSINLSRRHAAWESLERRDQPAPLHDRDLADQPTLDFLPTMTAGQEVMADYATVGLSLKQHPVALVRPALAKDRIVSSAAMNDLPAGRWVKVAGLVLVRQRPGTASGVVFITLEDETGVVNLILWSAVYERFRSAARHATLLQADGYVQCEGKVVHVLAKRLTDRSDLIRGLNQLSRDFH